MIYFRNDKNRNYTFRRNFINVSIIIIILMYLYTFYKIKTGYLGDSRVVELSFEYRFINFFMSVISIGCCYIYYRIYKKDDIFFIKDIYILVVIELLVSYYSNNNLSEVKDVVNLYVVFTYGYMAIIIYFMINNESRIRKWILEHKKTVSVVNILIMLLSFYIVKKLYFICPYMENKKMITVISYVFILYFSYGLLLLMIKSLRSNNLIYIVLVSSTSFLNIKNICRVFYSYKYNDTSYNISSILIFMAFISLLIGIFITLINAINEMKIKDKDLCIFRDIIDNTISSNVLIFNEEGKTKYMNKCCKETLGKEQDLDFEKYLSKECIEDIIASIEKKTTYDGIVLVKDGRVFKLNIRERKINNLVYRVSSGTDITEEYEKNKQLQINQEKLSGITNNINEVIAVFDIEGKLTYMNNTGVKLLKCSYEEIDGIYYRNICMDGYDEILRYINNSDIESTLIIHHMSYMNRSEIELETVFKKLVNDNGEISGYIVVSRDRKMKKELESVKEKYNEMLEYDKIRTEFFANISHEVRTPINIIYSCLQLLNKEKEKGADELYNYYGKYEKTIRQNCFRILRLINNILDISTYEFGFINEDFVNTDIICLVEDITMSVVPYVKAKGLNIMFDTDVEELIIKCNPEQIERVILNLISNAVKFTNDGGEILVDIKVDSKWVNIRVSDTGIGIESQLKDLVFERFVQTDKSFNRKKEGSGIGLALVKTIIENHGGKAIVESSSKEGTTFLIKIPNENNQDQELHVSENYLMERDLEEKIGIEFSDV